MSAAEELPEDAGDVNCAFECEASNAAWRVVDATITDELNQPYHLSLSLRTNDVDADPSDMLGEPCMVTIERGELVTQYPAVVHWIEDAAGGDRVMEVSVQASAALWMLSQNRQTRIFQDLTVPKILDEVLGAGLGGYERTHEADLGRTYPTCEYRVQYDESDFAFCARLMEEEGIIYRFNREDSAEVMVLVDDPHAGVDVESADGKDIHFSAQRGVRECVKSFLRHSAMRPNKLATRNFNWTLPSLPIEEEQVGEADDNVVNGAAIGPERETYQHDIAPPTLHEYTDDDGYKSNDATEQCQIRRELSARDSLVINGHGTVVGFSAGGLFALLDHNLEGDYLLTKVTHSIVAEGDGAHYSNRFTCLAAATPFRPDRRTPKPRVMGIETATVVGPSDQEIHTDKHGRIKVQFHWDREGDNDDHSTCFMRVVQPWAGAGWGFVFIPRIGMEVTVAFVQGDADRPIATGTVFNGENLTPYELPGDMTKSTIRTQSSPGGDGYNELSFEDKAGEEEIFIQAQKNMRETIKNSQTTSVGGAKSTSVGGNRSVSVDKNQTVHIKGSQNITIDGAEAGEGVTGGKMSITGDYKVDTSNEVTVEAPTKITLTCGGSTITMEPGKIRLHAGGGAELVLDAEALLKANGNAQVKLNANAEMKSAAVSKVFLDANALTQSSGGSKVLLDANALTQSSGGSKVLLDANALTEASTGGNVLLDADATVSGANATLAGDGEATVSGATAQLTGGEAKVSGGTVSVTGGLVSIN